jgi:ribosomal protein S18 acetylase RimI-like enzyme
VSRASAPPTRLRLRHAGLNDAAAIARVHVTTWRATYAGLVPDTYLVGMTEVGQMRFWRRLLGRPQAEETILVAEVESAAGAEVVGFGSCGPTRACGLPYRGEVFTLYVAGDWQNRGVGRSLIGRLFADLVERSRRDALIWVLSGNPARFFYQAMGGSPVAERKEAFAGTLLDETAYGWPDLESWLAIARDKESGGESGGEAGGQVRP